MNNIDDAINQAIASLEIDDLKVSKEQIYKIKECIIKNEDKKVLDDLMNISKSNKKEKINGR